MDGRHLIIMRHATAGVGAGRDHARPLTRTGLDEARRVGLRLHELGAIPDRILSSSALRCHETIQAVASGLGRDIPIELDDALYNASADQILATLAGIAEPGTLLLTAHNPGVSMFALRLSHDNAADTERLRAGFAPATIACFEIPVPWSELSGRTARLIRFEHAPAA